MQVDDINGMGGIEGQANQIEKNELTNKFSKESVDYFNNAVDV